MTVETMIANLSPEERRIALELLWVSFEREGISRTPPEWHGEVLADRLSNPSSEPALPLDESMQEIRRRVNERRSSS